MKEFITDLEARAALIPAAVRPREEYDICKYCKKPLPKKRRDPIYIDADDVCHVCKEMYMVIANRRYFIFAQMDYLHREGRLFGRSTDHI